MIFLTLLRALCLCYAGFLIVAGMAFGVMAAGVPQGESPMPLWEIMMIAMGLTTLLASGFLYAGLLGERMRGAVAHRVAAGVLLALPIAVGALLLLAKSHPEMRSIGWFLLPPAFIAFLGMTWPGLSYLRRAS